MKIGLVSDCLAGQSFEELLKTCKELGIEQVELGVGTGHQRRTSIWTACLRARQNAMR